MSYKPTKSASDATCVLVTRPMHQAAGFSALLAKNGITAVQVPTIEISFTNADLTKSLHSDIIIFTSANAVTGANRSLELPWDCPAKIAAIGSSTALALKELSCKVDIVPHNGASTEALLEAIGEVANLRVTIIRGDSGREVLYDTLKARGAIVRYQSVYKRSLPAYSATEITAHFNEGLPDIISVTSDLGLTNLTKIIPPELKSSLLSKPLVVNSARCAQLAADEGFTADILVAEPPGDDAQLAQILSLLENGSK